MASLALVCYIPLSCCFVEQNPSQIGHLIGPYLVVMIQIAYRHSPTPSLCKQGPSGHLQLSELFWQRKPNLQILFCLV